MSIWTMPYSMACGGMTTFLNLLQSEPDIGIPIMIDSSKFGDHRSGIEMRTLGWVHRQLHFAEGREKFIEQATICQGYGASVIVMAFDEKGQADTPNERKIDISQRAYNMPDTTGRF